MKVGVFIPIGNNGWLLSENAPQYKPSFELNKAITRAAERYGMDFALSMIKLRGFGGKTEFVLSSSGHIQSILNPPGNPKATYFEGGTQSADPQAWQAQANRHAGSWWPQWLAWIQQRSGEARPTNTQLGNAQYPPMEEAPGTYVHVR